MGRRHSRSGVRNHHLFNGLIELNLTEMKNEYSISIASVKDQTMLQRYVVIDENSTAETIGEIVLDMIDSFKKVENLDEHGMRLDSSIELHSPKE